MMYVMNQSKPPPRCVWGKNWFDAYLLRLYVFARQDQVRCVCLYDSVVVGSVLSLNMLIGIVDH